ncbi:hypothetical protein, partial [Rheinheimera baltica]
MLRVLRLQLLFLLCCLGIPTLAEQVDFSHLYKQIDTARQQGDMDKADQLALSYSELANQQKDLVEQGKAYYALGRN